MKILDIIILSNELVNDASYRNNQLLLFKVFFGMTREIGLLHQFFLRLLLWWSRLVLVMHLQDWINLSCVVYRKESMYPVESYKRTGRVTQDLFQTLWIPLKKNNVSPNTLFHVGFNFRVHKFIKYRFTVVRTAYKRLILIPFEIYLCI